MKTVENFIKMNKEMALLPCPFCGNIKPRIRLIRTTGAKFVECGNCNGSGPDADSWNGIKDKWNSRSVADNNGLRPENFYQRYFKDIAGAKPFFVMSKGVEILVAASVPGHSFRSGKFIKFGKMMSENTLSMKHLLMLSAVIQDLDYWKVNNDEENPGVSISSSLFIPDGPYASGINCLEIVLSNASERGSDCIPPTHGYYFDNETRTVFNTFDEGHQFSVLTLEEIAARCPHRMELLAKFTKIKEMANEPTSATIDQQDDVLDNEIHLFETQTQQPNRASDFN